MIVHILWSLFGYQVGHNLMNLNHNHLRSRSNCTIIFAKQSVPLTKTKRYKSKYSKLAYQQPNTLSSNRKLFLVYKKLFARIEFSLSATFILILSIWPFKNYDTLCDIVLLNNEWILTTRTQYSNLILGQLFCKVFA